MIHLHQTTIEGILNLIAAVGIIPYLCYIFRNPHRTLFEQRVGIMLTFYTAIILIRGMSEVLGLEVVYAKPILSLSMIFPLTAVLFVEGVMRRHVPQWLKFYSFLTPVFLLSSLAFVDIRVSTICTVVFRTSIIIALTALLFTERSKLLTKMEQALKQKVAVAFIFAFPFFMTDYGYAMNLTVIRMGSIGGLIFTLSCLMYSDEGARRRLIRMLSYTLLQALVTAIVFCYIFSSLNIPQFTIMFAVVLVSILVPMIIRVSLLTENHVMRNWPFKVLNQFRLGSNPVLHINNVLGGEGTFAYGEEELRAFDIEALRKFIKETGQIQFKMDYLKQLKDNFAAEQLLYILESDQNNTLMVLHQSPLVLLSLNNPTVTREVSVDSEQILLSRFVELSLGEK